MGRWQGDPKDRKRNGEHEPSDKTPAWTPFDVPSPLQKERASVGCATKCLWGALTSPSPSVGERERDARLSPSSR
jgi:hypothetical protein